MTREQKMSVSPQEVELAKRRKAVRLLAWSYSLDDKPIPYNRYCDTRGWPRLHED